MRRCLWVLVVVGCAHSTEVPSAAVVRSQLWVDGSAPEGGDGTRERPFKRLVPRAGATTLLATGLYALSGPLPEGVELVGDGKAVVLAGEGLTADGATLRRLAIQGGQVGLTVRGAVTLEDVSFSGQRQVAVHVEPTGVLRYRHGDVEGSVPESRGVVTRGRAEVLEVTFRGALRHGVTVEAGEALVSKCTSEGAATAVHVAGGRARVERTQALKGRAAAFSVKGARLTLEDVEVVGHEYGVLAGLGSEVDVDRLDVRQTQVGGVSLVGASARVKRLTATAPGSHGALASLDSKTQAEELIVRGAVDLAVLARHGTFEAKNVRIEGVTGDGDGVMVRDATARLTDVRVTDADGAGLVATAVATVTVDGLICERCRHGALVVERRSTVKAHKVQSVAARESAVTVAEDGVLELDGLEVSGGGLAVWAECTAASRVVLTGKLPSRERMSGRCVELSPTP